MQFEQIPTNTRNDRSPDDDYHELQPSDALALTRLVRRLSFGVVRQIADNDEDCLKMLAAAEKFRMILSDSGYRVT